MPIPITAPLSREDAKALRAGDSCLLSGVIYTARDAAHQRLCQRIAQSCRGEELPCVLEVDAQIQPQELTVDAVSLPRIMR